jgi:hypothetical protein
MLVRIPGLCREICPGRLCSRKAGQPGWYSGMSDVPDVRASPA